MSSRLQAVSMVIPGGNLISVCGPYGSGKTTLLRTLVGEETATGYVAVDGRRLELPLWRVMEGAVGYVPQSPSFARGTLRENIECSGRGSRGAFAEALRLSQLATDVESIPAGADTEIGDRGERLSGGQRTRAAYARAVLGDPRSCWSMTCGQHWTGVLRSSSWTTWSGATPPA